MANANGILCQSIHEETSGRFILVGVLSGVIQVMGADFEDECSLFMNLSNFSEGDHKLAFRLTNPDGKKSQIEITTTIEKQQVGANLQITSIPLRTKTSGVFTLEWKTEGGKWKQLVSVPIELLPEPEDDEVSV